MNNTWAALKTAVSLIIKANGNREITGPVLQSVLNNIVTNVGENATFVGIANNYTSPGVPDGRVFYFATAKGDYPNFDGISIPDGGIYILYNRGDKSWACERLFGCLQTTGDSTEQPMSQKAVTELLAELKNQIDLTSNNVVYHYRGEWSYDTAVSDNPYRYWVEVVDGRRITHIDYAVYDGYRWACMLDETQEIPSMDTGDWMLIDPSIGQSVRMEIDTDGQTILDYGESITVKAQICLQLTPINLIPYYAKNIWEWKVTRDTGDEVEDEAWNRDSKAVKFSAETGSNNFIILSYKADENDLGTSSGKYGAKFTLHARSSNVEELTKDIYI